MGGSTGSVGEEFQDCSSSLDEQGQAPGGHVAERGEDTQGPVRLAVPSNASSLQPIARSEEAQGMQRSKENLASPTGSADDFDDFAFNGTLSKAKETAAYPKLGLQLDSPMHEAASKGRPQGASGGLCVSGGTVQHGELQDGRVSVHGMKRSGSPLTSHSRPLRDRVGEAARMEEDGEGPGKCRDSEMDEVQSLDALRATAGGHVGTAGVSEETPTQNTSSSRGNEGSEQTSSSTAMHVESSLSPVGPSGQDRPPLGQSASALPHPNEGQDSEVHGVSSLTFDTIFHMVLPSIDSYTVSNYIVYLEGIPSIRHGGSIALTFNKTTSVWSSQAVTLNSADIEGHSYHFVLQENRKGLGAYFFAPNTGGEMINFKGYQLQAVANHFDFPGPHMAQGGAKAGLVVAAYIHHLAHAANRDGLKDALMDCQTIIEKAVRTGRADWPAARCVILRNIELYTAGALGNAEGSAVFLCIASCMVLVAFLRGGRRHTYSGVLRNREHEEKDSICRQLLPLLDSLLHLQTRALTTGAQAALKAASAALVEGASGTSAAWIAHLAGLAIADEELNFLARVQRGRAISAEEFCQSLDSAEEYLRTCPDPQFQRILNVLLEKCPSLGALLPILMLERVTSSETYMAALVDHLLSFGRKGSFARSPQEIIRLLERLPEEGRRKICTPLENAVFDMLRGHGTRTAEDLSALRRLVNADALFFTDGQAQKLVKHLMKGSKQLLQDLVPPVLNRVLADSSPTWSGELSSVTQLWLDDTLARTLQATPASVFGCVASLLAAAPSLEQPRHAALFATISGWAEKKAKQMRPDLVLADSIAIFEQLPSALCLVYLRVAVEVLKQLQRTPLSALKAARSICDSAPNAEQLEVPSRYAEHLLIELLDLLPQLPSTGLGCLNILKSEFWLLLASATGHVEKLRNHGHLTAAKLVMRSVDSLVCSQKLTVAALRILLELPAESVTKYFKGFCCRADLSLVKDMEAVLKEYERRLAVLREFLDCFCVHLAPQDLDRYEQDLVHRAAALDNLPVIHASLADHWTLQQPLLAQADALGPVCRSLTLANQLRTGLADLQPSQQLTVVEIATDIVPRAQARYRLLWSSYFEQSDMSLDEVGQLWEAVPISNLELEYELAGQLLDRPASDVTIPSAWVGEYLQAVPRLQTAKQLLRLVEVFGLSSEGPLALAAQAFRACLVEVQMPSLVPLWRAGRTLQEAQLGISAGVLQVVHELTGSDELLKFLRETLDEDLRFMINAVEEHSTQFIRPATVRDLNDVQRLLKPLLKGVGPEWTLEDFLKQLDIQVQGSEAKVAAMIADCAEHAYGLRRIFRNVANRGEMTLDAVRAIVHGGVFTFSTPSADMSAGCQVSLSSCGANKKATSETVHSAAEIADLRSRALLLVNVGSAQRPDEDVTMVTKESIAVEYFVTQVDIANQVAATASKLFSDGNFAYRKWERSAALGDGLERLLTAVIEEEKAWQAGLRQARLRYYFLNFFHAHQLWALLDFCSGVGGIAAQGAAIDILKWANPRVEDQLWELEAIEHSDQPLEQLEALGKWVHSLLARSLPFERPVPGSVPTAPLETLLGAPSKLLISTVERPQQVLNAVLGLFLKHCSSLPAPADVLLCTRDTTWEEVELLLFRAFFYASNSSAPQLFCLAHVEQLEFTAQCQLVTTLQNLGQEAKAGAFLALVACTKGQHPLEQLASHSHRVEAPPSDEQLAELFCRLRPTVSVVTSDLPGNGKTELVYQKAAAAGCFVVPFPVSGGTARGQLVSRLKELPLGRHRALHVDLGAVDAPAAVNLFLFELLVLGAISAGDAVFHASIETVFLELANTLDGHLLKELSVVSWFSREHLEWDIDRLHVSRELTSPVQVVCNFLAALEGGSIDQKDLVFVGHDTNARARSKQMCCRLLRKYFTADGQGMSFTRLHAFLAVLAEQLRALCLSDFFRVEQISAMVEEQTVRSLLVKAFIDVAREFAVRSVKVQAPSLDAVGGAERMAARVEGMLQWQQSNHLLVVFHSLNPHTITALYRDHKEVPESVALLLKSQRASGADATEFELEDFQTMPSNQLLLRLERIVCTSRQQQEYPPYALTADNLLKMALISLRVRAGLPVVVMGETGCGKTSLISFLARVARASFRCLNVHAGTSEADIMHFIETCEAEADKDSTTVWAFMDEINTCDHIGLINEIVVHRTILGRRFCSHLVILAACNPYRLRSAASQQTAAGLTKASRLLTDDQRSRLVYRVHPLPEALLDHVWDYGTLNPDDERLYIHTMMQKVPRAALVIDVLTTSQAFIRARDGEGSVSLRDVKRCKDLLYWFLDAANKRCKARPPSDQPGLLEATKAIAGKVLSSVLHGTRAARAQQRKASFPNEIRAIVLALAHCYHSRLATEDERACYRGTVAAVFEAHEVALRGKDFVDITRQEQLDYLNRMKLPPGTAKNAALLENVFVTLVCILNKIPIFIVGKPGCSKSLSMQLINSNLRGPDSSDDFFRQLPQVYVVPYQGSESSTSDGILKVFEKAQSYLRQTSEGEVLPVVLLDEVGLAEISRHNPLKVLHSLLEPGYPNERPNVAVVGISNWALDPAKMNRAVHLSRPEPDFNDLYLTAKAILQGYLDDGCRLSTVLDSKIQALARAYSRYQTEQPLPNFHGLRDFYSLIRSLRSSLARDAGSSDIMAALGRNFGGVPKEVATAEKVFFHELRSCGHEVDPVDVLQLVKANLEDCDARHLMLITHGDAAVGVLEHTLGISAVKIYGSHFADDQSEEYSYRMLSKIILCMETGGCLILKNMDSIYGSLYDMLNQNYQWVGSRRNCRIALGPYSNPMCHVHETFRCIVLVDQDTVGRCDPPFLNRFEKQLLSYEPVLNPEMREAVEHLQVWVKSISTLQVNDDQEATARFDEHDMFCGFHADTLPSLVLANSQSSDDFAGLLDSCKEALVQVATADAVLRAPKSRLAQEFPDEVAQWTNCYHNKQQHGSLREFVSKCMQRKMGNVDGAGEHAVIMTFSSIHCNVSQLLEGTCDLQVDKLGAFSSEKQLVARVQTFFQHPTKSVLLLQADALSDRQHLQLAKFILDEYGSGVLNKNVCIVIHMHRSRFCGDVEWSGFSFLCGWRQVTLDTLEPQEEIVTRLLHGSLTSVLKSTEYDFKTVAQKMLHWCFMCIRYPDSVEAVHHVRQMARSIAEEEELLQCFEAWTLAWLEDKGSTNWQMEVACNRRRLLLAPSLGQAIVMYIDEAVAKPLAMLIYVLERSSSLQGYFGASADLQKLWRNLVLDASFINVEDLAEPQGSDCYTIGQQLNLKMPFAQLYFQAVNGLQEDFMCRWQEVVESLDAADPTFEERLEEEESRLLCNLCSLADQAVPATLVECGCAHARGLYFHDFVLLSAPAVEGLSPALQQQAFLWLLEQHVGPFDHPAVLHATVWRQKELAQVQMQLLSVGLGVLSLEELKRLREEELTRPPEEQQERPLSEFLVSAMTAAMLPDDEVLRNFGGAEGWLRATSRLLAKCSALLAASEVNCPLGLHVLRALHDYVRLVYLPWGGEVKPEEAPLLNALEAMVMSEVFADASEDSPTKEPCQKLLRKEGDQSVSSVTSSVYSTTLTEELSKGLSMLVRLAKSEQGSFLQDHAMLEDVHRFTNHLRKRATGAQQDALARFWCSLIGRCLDFGADGEVMSAVCRHIVGAADMGATHVGPLLLRLVRGEEAERPGCFEEVLCGVTAASCFADLEEALRAVGDSLDSQVACLLVDVLEEAVFCGMDVSEAAHSSMEGNGGELEWPVPRLLACLRESIAVLRRQDLKVGGSMCVLSAVAFMRALLRAVSQEILTARDCNVEMLGSVEKTLLSAVMEALAAPGARMEAIKVYFLKVLRQQLGSFRALQELTASLAHLDASANPFSALPWCKNQTSASPLGVNALVPLTEPPLTAYKEALKAVDFLALRGNDAELTKVVQRAATDARAAEGLLAALVYHFHWRTAGEQPSESDKATFSRVLEVLSSEGSLKSAAQALERLVSGAADISEPLSLLQVDAETSASGLRLAGLMAHLMVVLETGSSTLSPLHGYFSDPAAHAGSYFLASPSNEEATVMNALVGNGGIGHTRYRCNRCNYVFLVMACGLPTENGTCPGCGVLIPGNHQQPQGMTRVDAEPIRAALPDEDMPGYIVEDPGAIANPYHAVRSLSPAVYRTLHLLVHMALYCAHELHRPLGSLPAKDTLQGHVLNDSQQLQVLLGCSVDVMASAFHSVIASLGRIVAAPGSALARCDGFLGTALARQEWERAFAAELAQPVLQNVQQAAAAFSLLVEEQLGRDGSASLGGAFEAEIEERPIAMTAAYQQAHLPRLLRLSVPRSFSDFKAAFHLRPELQKEHPFLAAFFRQEAALEEVRHLSPLLSWTNEVIRSEGHRLQRGTALKTSAQEFINGAASRVEQFQAFAVAWNAVKDKVEGRACRRFPHAVPAMDPTQKLSLSCIEARDMGTFVLAMVEYLAALQNDFLEAALVAASAGCGALRHLELADGVGAVAAIPVQQAKPCHVVAYEWDDDLLVKYSWCKPEYGRGSEVEYDFAKIEAELAHVLVVGKAHLQVDAIVEFPYGLELFHGCSSILQAVTQKVPQEDLTPDQLASVQGDHGLRGQAATVLGSLDLALAFLKRAGGNPQQKLAEFAAQWLPAHAAQHLNRRSLAFAELRHMVGLYEALEDSVADILIDCIDSAYTASLPAQVEQELLGSLEGHGGKLPVAAFAQVLRRFMVRFLSVDKYKGTNPASLYLAHEDLMRWPRGVASGLDLGAVFPEGLLLCHMYQAYVRLQQEEEGQKWRERSGTKGQTRPPGGHISDARRLPKPAQGLQKKKRALFSMT